MARLKGSSQKSISNLSIGLINAAFLLLVEHSLPVYKKNMNHARPPVAGPENVNAAAAIVLLLTGLDYHLCRLKYLRDIAKHKPALPYTPYFNWTFEDAPATKLQKLLIHRKESRLLKQLIELTVCRDAIVHPKVYTVTHFMDADLNYKELKANLAPGSEFRGKALINKMKRREVTTLLHVPLVPTWVSYVDVVICILVLHRFLNLLEYRYGNPYAWVGKIMAYERETKDLFTGWNWRKKYPSELEDWVEAFYNSLSAQDQKKVKKAIGGNLSVYLRKQLYWPKLPKGSKGTVTEIVKAMQNPQKPDFLSKPPPQTS